MTTPAAGTPGIRLATVAGVPIYLGRTWLILAGVIVFLIGPGVAESRPDLGVLAYGVALLYAVLLLVAVLVHEAGHALAARAFGFPVHRVVADLWGGHTALDASTSRPGTSAVVAVVGPAANLALAGVGYALTFVVPTGVPYGLASAFAFLNAALAAFNLLPGLPLDGGQLVEAVVWKLTGSRARGRTVAGYAGLVVTGLVVVWFVGRPLLRGTTPSFVSLAWTLLIGMFLWQGARQAISYGRAGAAIEGKRILDALQPVVGVPAGTPLSQLPTGLPPVVLGDDGTPLALVDVAALQSVPLGAAGSTPVSAVSRPQPVGWVVEADPDAPLASILPALGSVGTGVLALRHDGRLLGVVTAERVNALFPS